MCERTISMQKLVGLLAFTEKNCEVVSLLSRAFDMTHFISVTRPKNGSASTFGYFFIFIYATFSLFHNLLRERPYKKSNYCETFNDCTPRAFYRLFKQINTIQISIQLKKSFVFVKKSFCNYFILKSLLA